MLLSAVSLLSSTNECLQRHFFFSSFRFILPLSFQLLTSLRVYHYMTWNAMEALSIGFPASNSPDIITVVIQKSSGVGESFKLQL